MICNKPPREQAAQTFLCPHSAKVEPSGLRGHQHLVMKKMIHAKDKEGEVKKSRALTSTNTDRQMWEPADEVREKLI